MPHTLHIVISDDETGETIIGIKEPVDVKTPSRRLCSLLSEKYILLRLLDEVNASPHMIRKRLKNYNNK